MSTIKVEDVAHVRFTAPDLERMREFLLDFGLFDAESSTDGTLRMRGTGPAPFVHETRPGEPGFAALALRAASVADLQTLARSENVPLDTLTSPGGGKVVRLKDPNGFAIEVIAGQASVPVLRSGVRDPWNSAASRQRNRKAKRVAAGPARVLRFGHAVFIVNDVAKSSAWYRERFGFLMSDEVRTPDGGLAAVFIRCDRGEQPADHHTLNFAALPGKPAQFHHAAFEVGDLDDLMAGHERLKAKGYTHSWGVGRHILGSQVFDYWQDPWGHKVEHWTDGDLFTAADAPAVTDIPTMLGGQWGPPPPAGFV